MTGGTVIRERRVDIGTGTLNVAEIGDGPPLLLLHGWPEFWLTWEPVMHRLADRFRLIAPDLRGFGDSDKPDGPFGPDGHSADMLALLDALGLRQVGLVGHDVGGPVIMMLARKAPELLSGLFLFDFVHPGIGARLGAPDHLKEIWYQSFNQLDLAVELVGASRETCRTYFAYFLRHWCHRKHAFDDVLDAFVDNFMKPGNIAGGFQHYKASHDPRIAMMKGDAPKLPPIGVPTCVRWGEHDPVLLSAWTDRLDETFSDLDVAIFPDVGHFPHREDPDRAAAEIGSFFAGRS